MTFQGLILGVVSVVLCRAEGDTATQSKVVELGGNVTLRCVLRGPHDILQVTFQKTVGKKHENVATYHPQTGVTINESYRGRLNFTHLSLNDTAITIWRVRIQDDGCYLCLFNTFPHGSIPRNTCLTVYEQLRGSLHYIVSEGNLTAICFAHAWPRPVISWIVPNVEGETTEEVVPHLNGTVSVTSKFYVNSSTSLIGQELICRVQHMNKDTDYRVKVKVGWSFSSPGSLAIVAVVFIGLVLTVVVVCWRKSRKKESGRTGLRADAAALDV